MLHCKSISEHLGQTRWDAFQIGMEQILASEREAAEKLLRVATSNASASLNDRGTFLEIRQCTVNVCPIGRTPSLSKEERIAFDSIDKGDGMRRRVLAELVRHFG